MRRTSLPRSAFQTRKPPRAGRPVWKCADEFKRWLRKLPCACQGQNACCGGPIQAAHVDHAGKGTRDAKAMSSKVADRFCVPLSMGCHQHQTDVIGWSEFEMTLPGGSAEALADEYWKAWPGRAAWERDLAEREFAA